MTRQDTSTRLLIYSHDSFGLGHLRRCRAIANSLVGHRKELSVLILSGSPIIGSFDFRTRVDFVRIPGVIKLRDGDYTSLSLDMSIDELMDVRAAIIEGAARAFNPDIFLVDKEPLGLEKIKYLTKNINIPWFAIGGINKNNICSLKSHGIRQIAIVSGLLNAKDPKEEAIIILKELSHEN